MAPMAESAATPHTHAGAGRLTPINVDDDAEANGHFAPSVAAAPENGHDPVVADVVSDTVAAGVAALVAAAVGVAVVIGAEDADTLAGVLAAVGAAGKVGATSLEGGLGGRDPKIVEPTRTLSLPFRIASS
mmetsp:Transcript_67727/g.109860  ORF Transcript_67727/g.109860 Transcript_67727/m.109860 type:complete len:131 (-) Transcript_67727:630-1022(-)